MQQISAPWLFTLEKESIKTHGGKRIGAGRKVREEPKVGVTVKVEPEVKDRFLRICEAKGRSQADQFSEMVKRQRL